MSNYIESYKQFIKTLRQPERRQGESYPAFCKRYQDWAETIREFYAAYPPYNPNLHKPARTPDGRTIDENEDDPDLPEMR
jgi:hypothetical protein